MLLSHPFLTKRTFFPVRLSRFIMTPARIMYLIRYQGPQWFEPVTYFGNNTLKDVFDYEPVQKDWKPEYESLLMGI